MDFLTGKIKPMYVKYLSAAFGSALISSIYGVVDMAMVGQYQGPDGTAALAVVAPIGTSFIALGSSWGLEAPFCFPPCAACQRKISGSPTNILLPL